MSQKQWFAWYNGIIKNTIQNSFKAMYFAILLNANLFYNLTCSISCKVSFVAFSLVQSRIYYMQNLFNDKTRV